MRRSDAPSVPTAPQLEARPTVASTLRRRAVHLFCVLCLVFLSTAQLHAQSDKEADPDPDDFLNIDKEAVLDKQSLAKNFSYPDSAKKAGLQGTVRVKVLIGKDGTPERYLITEGVAPILDSAAAQAVMKAGYTAASYHGVLLKSWMEVPIIFRFNNVKKPPIRFESDPEGDGYEHCQFDINRLYDSLNRTQMGFQKVPILKLDLVVDASGKILALQCASTCAPEARAEVERVLRTLSITPGFRNGQAAIDHVRLVIDCNAFIKP